MACPQQNLTDRAYRYQSVKNAELLGPERCAFCGSSHQVMVGHVDGHEENVQLDNLIWTCRSCNAVAANTMQRAGLGRLTHQYNPTKSGGAYNVGEWAKAVGAIAPRSQSARPGPIGSSDRNEALRAASTMSVADAVAMIRATPHSKRSQFAARLGRKSGRYNPTRSNLFGWGSKPAKKTSRKTGSGMTLARAVQQAKAAGAKSKDEGEFLPWLESKGLDDRSEGFQSRVRSAYFAGVESAGADVEEARAKYSRMMDAKTKKLAQKAVASAKKSDAYDSIPSEEAVQEAYKNGAKTLREALEMAGARQNPKKHHGATHYRAIMTVYSPNLPPTPNYYGPFLTRADAIAELKKQMNHLRENKRRFPNDYKGWRFTGRVQSFREGRELNPARRRNSAEASDTMYEKFHGKPSDSAVFVEDEEHVHEHLAVLGLLMEMRIDTVTGLRAVISLEDDPPFLCTSEDGMQLYIEAGDQKLDLKALGFTKEWIKDRIVIGRFSPPEGKEKWNIGYQTQKDFDNFEDILYQHDLGEETSASGKTTRVKEEDRVRPQLEYEPRNEKLFITGGKYAIKVPLLGTSPGIEN